MKLLSKSYQKGGEGSIKAAAVVAHRAYQQQREAARKKMLDLQAQGQGGEVRMVEEGRKDRIGGCGRERPKE